MCRSIYLTAVQQKYCTAALYFQTGRKQYIMKEKRNNKNIWNSYAKLYDFEISRFSSEAYSEMSRLMAEVLSPEMTVLEAAAGTGLISLSIAGCVRHIEAVDFSPKMIEKAKKKKVPDNVRFSVEDASDLSFDDSSFDAVIIANALHIMPDPAGVLLSISRVLRPGGLLIAPTYSHGHLKDSSWNLSTKLLRLIGFETYSKWKPDEYTEFIRENGFHIGRTALLKAAFPLMYLEARKA